jgi:hypothetical protein
LRPAQEKKVSKTSSRPIKWVMLQVLIRCRKEDSDPRLTQRKKTKKKKGKTLPEK